MHRCTETVTAGKATRAIDKILNCSREVMQGTHRKNNKGGKKGKLGDGGNGSKLIEKYIKSPAIGNLAQPNLLLGRNCVFDFEDSEIFDTKSSPQAACNYMFVSMTSNQDVIDIIRDNGFP